MNSRHPRSCFDRKTSKVIHENEKALPPSLQFKRTIKISRILSSNICNEQVH
jgi:hypothetical protein